LLISCLLKPFWYPASASSTCGVSLLEIMLVYCVLYYCIFVLVWNLLCLASYLCVYFINFVFILSSPGTLRFFNCQILISTCRSAGCFISCCGVHITTIHVQPYHPLLIYTVVWSLRYLLFPILAHSYQ
jgi:hypothetical protein